MNQKYRVPTQKATQKTHYRRDETVSHVIDFEQARNQLSQRKWAKVSGIPRTTLQFWLQRKKDIDADPQLTAFFESPVGLAFLHRLVIAAEFEFVENGVASIHNICNFLNLSGLCAFVASSFGAQQKALTHMDELIIAFSQSERGRLSVGMPRKKISLCEDETFHPDVCLVAIEPTSDFLVLEKYVSDRSADTWNQHIRAALCDLPVDVVQCSSDEARGLINHAKEGLKAHHSPDLFHVIHEIGKGTSGALASTIKQAENEVQSACENLQSEEKHKERYENKTKRPVGRRPDFEKKIAQAQAQKQKAEENLNQARQNQEAVRRAKAEISQGYHPYDPITGNKQPTEVVSTRLEACFEKIGAAIVSLSERCKKRVEKAYRVVTDMRATIAFFFHTINLYVQDMDVSSPIKKIMHENLIPGYYLQYVANKEKDPERKLAISHRSKELLSVLYRRDGPLSDCTAKQIQYLERSAKECAQLFQRSSSCVEGRNAQLSLHHHGVHRLSNRKLQALTAVHNYYTKRSDGTTAAERFFEAKPKDMFEWLLEHMNLPARPRCRSVGAS